MATTKPLTDAITALTTYANSVTGASDTTLSDAVGTLAAGYGGGGGIEKITGSVQGNGTNTISFTFPKKPKIIAIYREDFKAIQAVADRAQAVTLFMDGFGGASVYSNAGASALANGGVVLGNNNITSTTTPGVNRCGYVDGTLYIKSGNNATLWSASLTYNYEIYVE